MLRIYLLAFISGGCALSYEIVWFRLLANVCGSSILAASVITALFLAGLALGAFWIGRLADRMAQPIRTFALLEAGIGASGLMLLGLFPWFEGLLAVGKVPADLILIASMGLLLFPTFLMGGTLPVLAKGLPIPDNAEVLSRLYAVNTAGAATGVFACAFLLLPNLGQTASVMIAALLNSLAALLAWFSGQTRQVSSPLPFGDAQPGVIRWWAVLLLTGIIGGCSLALEILWTRGFPLYLGNTTYAFALVLIVFLFGLATGSMLYRKYLMAGCSPQRAVLWLLGLMAAGALPSLLAFDRLSFLFYEVELIARHNWLLLVFLRGVIVTVVVLPATIASGALFPALMNLVGGGDDVRGRIFGFFLGLNTGGSVIGSLAVPLVIVPAFGLQGGFRCVILVLAALSVFCTVMHKDFSARWLALPIALMICAVLPIRWDPYLVNSGVYVYAPEIKAAGGLLADRAKWQMLFHSEEADATVAVSEERATQVRSFIVNGKVDGGTADMPTQVLLGQLPMLLHSAPEKTLVIGLGTGITLAETLKYPENRSLCYEISPGVITAARYFSAVTGSATAHPRATVVNSDARKELLLNQSTYDVIVSEPSNPWQSGNSRLFTRDFYRLVRLRLNQGGIFCQWLPIYDLNKDALASAVVTFLEQFPASVAFIVNGTDLLLVGKDSGLITIDVEQLQKKWAVPEIAKTFKQIGFADPFDFISKSFVGGPALLNTFVQGATANSDNHNKLEFYRFTKGVGQRQENLQAIVAANSSLRPQDRFAPLSFGRTTLGESSREQLSAYLRRVGNFRDAEAVLQVNR